MKLLVIRHAIAEDSSPTGQDKDRPLSVEGRQKFDWICKGLSSMKLKFDLLLDSPLLRSQQTADIFCEYFSIPQRERSLNLKPLAEVSDLLPEISAYNKPSVVIVGHQPFLSQFVSYCLTKDRKIFVSLKRGALAFLEFPLSVHPGTALLKSLLAPKYFENLLKKKGEFGEQEGYRER